MSTAVTLSDALTGSCVGPYRVLQKLGGNMGVVFKAEDTRLNRMVALKFLPEKLTCDPQTLKRFHLEARAASALNHPNICTIYDIDEHGGRPFIAMEFLAGQSLRQFISGKALSLESVIGIGIQISDALASAHAKGIIHRDIKPTNIFVTESGKPKLLDFGLAKMLRRAELGHLNHLAAPETTTSDPHERTSPGLVVGTIGYMSPEQARGEDVDERTDLFSFAAVLYEMATGRVAFPGRTAAVVFNAILSDERWQQDSKTDLPEYLEHIIRKGLEKDPDLRYQTAREIRADLKRLKRDMLSLHTWREKAIPVPWMKGAQTSFAHTIRSLVVLPLANISLDPEQEYFSDGMTEALISDLAKIRALRVVSRTSAMHYKGKNKSLREIARELNVDGIVEGSVVRAGDRVRVTAELINATNDSHVWVESFERDLRDILALQAELAQAIARGIKINLTPQEHAQFANARPVNPEAHEAYLRGRYHWNTFSGEGFKKAIGYFEKAIQKDPEYAPGYAGLADSYVWLSGPVVQLLPPRDCMPRARAAAMKALALDDTLAEAHTSLARVKVNYEWDWQAAENELRRAIELNPNLASPYTLSAYRSAFLGNYEEAILASERAKELEPLVPIVQMIAGVVRYSGRAYDEAIEQLTATLEMFPDCSSASWVLAASYAGKQMFSEAIRELETRTFLSDANLMPKAFLGFAYASAGESEKAAAVLRELELLSERRYVPSTMKALIYCGLREHHKAFHLLSAAYEERDAFLVSLKVMPLWDALRADGQFSDYLRRVGLL